MYVHLAPDGRLSHCNRSSDLNSLDYGTIYEKSLSQALADPKRRPLLDRNRVLFEGECRGCRFWNICHGGCPLHSWYETGSFMHKSFLCGAKKDFIEKYVEPILGGREPGRLP
jgi:radical SAM protein with 4Fe4S-binding SPASM domain